MNLKSAHLTRSMDWAALKARMMTIHPGLLLRIWVVLRLPLLLVALYIFARDEFIWLATVSAIHLFGTVPERVVAFLLIGLLLGASFMIARRLPSPSLRYLIPLLVVGAAAVGIFRLVSDPQPFMAALFLTGVLAINTMSDAWLISFISGKRGRLITSLIFAIVIGLSEILLLKPLLVWLSGQQNDNQNVKISPFAISRGWLPTLILVPGLTAFMLDPYNLSDFHRALFPDPRVHRIAGGNFSWTDLDLKRRVLYAGGFGTNHLQMYNIDTPDQPPLVSPVENGYAQGFAYNALDQEIYIYNVLTHELLTLDAVTLELKNSAPASQLSPGDVWIAWDRFSDSIILASEADEQVGIPTVIVDRRSGQVLDQLTFDPGNMALHPNKPWLYLSFLRRINELLVYDLEQHQIVKRTPAAERLDRMIFVPGEKGEELFASAPLESEVLRFDAETLARKETIKTILGGRAIAVDSTRNWLLCGSLVTHQLEVIDLASGQRIAEYYLGPWLRTIVLDPEAGIAYVSSHDGLFTVQYASQP